jgi:hypothetical protein
MHVPLTYYLRAKSISECLHVDRMNLHMFNCVLWALKPKSIFCHRKTWNNFLGF